MQTTRRRVLASIPAAGLTLAAGRLFGQTAGPRRLDVHQHFVSPAYHALITRKNAVSPVAGLPFWRDYTPAKNLEAMDKAGIETAMLSPTAPAAWFGDAREAAQVARELNDYAASEMVGAYKGRFGLFACLPMPDVEGSLREIEYAYDKLKVDGVALLTSFGDKYLGDPAFAPVFAELNRRKAVVYTHPLEADCCRNPVAGVTPQTLEYPTDTVRAIMSLVVSGTAARCPDVQFIFSHAGGTLLGMVQRFLGAEMTPRGLSASPDPASRLYQLRRFYYDTAGSANPIQMQALKALVGMERIVYGTDFPFFSAEATSLGVDACGFSAAELVQVNRTNALRLLSRRT